MKLEHGGQLLRSDLSQESYFASTLLELVLDYCRSLIELDQYMTVSDQKLSHSSKQIAGRRCCLNVLLKGL